MNARISHRMAKPDFQADFINQVLAAAADPNLISFAGGLPNAVSFPVGPMEEAAKKVLERDGVQALQYNKAQGYLPLRQIISERYKKGMGLDISPDEIIITNGSQQALDMFAAVMIDAGDPVMVESPSYLAALQTFHLYDPNILPVKLNDDGIDVKELKETIEKYNPKFIYIIPNFQNPTGLTYSEEVRVQMAEVLKGTDVVVLEDNPYGELRFTGTQGHSLRYFLDEQVCMLGTFSKIVSPGMRIGWIACKEPVIFNKLLNYKSTMDLHTNIFGQMVMAQYLTDNDVEAHIEKAKELYKKKAELMMDCIAKYCPEGCSFTKPEGGMFIWVTVPEGVKAIDVQREAVRHNVVTLPGDPFYEYERDVRTMRLNYSNSTDEAIETGIKILGDAIRTVMNKQ